SPEDEENTRSSHKYPNDLEEKYQARALLAKSKRFFKKGTHKFSSAKATDQTKCHKCGKKGKYNKVKAKLALLSSSASASKASTVKVLMALAEDNDAVRKEGARNGEWVKISMRKCISEQIPSQKKRVLGVDQLTKDPSSSGQKDLVFLKSSADDTKVSIPGVERPWLSKAKGFILPNHDTSRILLAESQRNIIDPSVAATDSLMTEYDSADESLVCNTPLPPLKKLNGAIINKPSSAPDKGSKNSLASVVNSAPVGKLKSLKIKDDPPLAIVMKELNNLKLQFSKNQSSYSRSNQPQQEAIWYLESGCSRHMTGVKSYLYKYVEQPGPKMVFRDDSTCITEGLMRKEEQSSTPTKEIVMIAPRVRDVYVLDMTSYAQDSCFFAKASENLNWLWQ
ncbi:hypothetical protein Tco_0654385, partial [Tanacetum coccineum]